MLKKVLSLLLRSKEPEAIAVPERKTKRKLCEEWLNTLDPERFSNYQSSVGLAYTIPVVYSNIDRYTQKLKDACLIILDGNLITPDWAVVKVDTMSLDRFLISDDGFYQDVKLAVTRYKEQALNLCKLLEKSDHADVGNDEHNMRMLTKLFANIHSTTVKLVEVSLTS